MQIGASVTHTNWKRSVFYAWLFSSYKFVRDRRANGQTDEQDL